jgi:phage FluMu protein Com
MTGTVKCNKCGTILNEAHDIQVDKRAPCPSCDSTSRRYEESALVKIGVVTGGKMKGKHANEKRPFIEQSSGKDLYRKTGQLMDKIMVVDHDQNLYQEIATSQYYVDSNK